MLPAAAGNRSSMAEPIAGCPSLSGEPLKLLKRPYSLLDGPFQILAKKRSINSFAVSIHRIMMCAPNASSDGSILRPASPKGRPSSSCVSDSRQTAPARARLTIAKSVHRCRRRTRPPSRAHPPSRRSRAAYCDRLLPVAPSIAAVACAVVQTVFARKRKFTSAAA